MVKTVKKSVGGFSLVEVIVASIILSTSVVALCAIGNKSMTGVKRNREYEQAWELMDKQLTMISMMGIDQFLEEDQMEGQLGRESTLQAQSGEETSQASHYWKAEVVEGEADNLYEVKLSISWGRQNRPRSIYASTRFNGVGEFEETEEPAEENQQQQGEPR